MRVKLFNFIRSNCYYTLKLQYSYCVEINLYKNRIRAEFSCTLNAILENIVPNTLQATFKQNLR